MTDNQATTEEMVDAIHAFAADELRRGAPRIEIQMALIERGLDHESAAVVMANLRQAESAGVRAAGTQNMVFGGLWCIGGLVVTVITRATASGGGLSIVAWGAIVLGGIQFFRGLIQCNG